MIYCTLPWPTGVSTNHLYQRNRYGGVRLSARARAWKEAAILAVRQAGGTLPDGPLLLQMCVYPPDGRRRDLDNLIKLTQDAVFAALGIDDSRVSHLLVARCERLNKEAGQIGVTIMESPERQWERQRLGAAPLQLVVVAIRGTGSVISGKSTDEACIRRRGYQGETGFDSSPPANPVTWERRRGWSNTHSLIGGAGVSVQSAKVHRVGRKYVGKVSNQPIAGSIPARSTRNRHRGQ